jgi:hypothetical protein
MNARVFKAGRLWFAAVPEGLLSGVYVLRSFATWSKAIDFALYPWA